MVDVQKFFSGLSLPDLFKCRDILSTTIEQALVADKKHTAIKKIEDYTHYTDDFVPKYSDLYNEVRHIFILNTSIVT